MNKSGYVDYTTANRQIYFSLVFQPIRRMDSASSSTYQQLVSSPVLGAAAAVAVGAAYMMYTKQYRSGGDSGKGKCPVKHREGIVEINDMHKLGEERLRDFFRFYKSRYVHTKSRGGEVSVFKSVHEESADSVVRELVKVLPKGTDIDALIFSLSTSLGMEVLLKIGVVPAMISQPVFVVHTGTGLVELLGFIGDNVRGTSPDSKFTDWLIRISVSTNKDPSKVRYHVSPRPHNCTRTSDLI
jgi:hypothetical protein